MKQVCDINKCTGCSACMQICPKKCIKMLPDKQGHIISVIDEKQCINCERCVKTCPANYPPAFNYPKQCYAAWAKNEDVRMSCASGGISTVLSEYIINNGGIVYGCAILKELEFKHIRVDNIKDLELLKGSKYVYSNCEDVYKNIKQDWSENKKVLFIGTPCQKAGILNYIGKNENLYTIDLICHGFPSQQMLKELFAQIDIKDIKSVKFRENNVRKIIYEKQNGENITICNLSKQRWQNYYYEGFLSKTIIRNSCFECLFSKPKRIGDITLGDFWGIGKKEKFEHSTKNGCCACLINTDKGQNLFNNIKDNIECYERNINEAIEGNHSLREISKKNLNSIIFNFLYPKINFNSAVFLSCFDKILKYKIKRTVKNGISLFQRIKTK